MVDQPSFVSCGVDLQPLNSLAIAVHCAYFAEATEPSAALEVIAWQQAKQLPLLILGGGSNLVLCGDWPGLVLQYTNSDFQILEQNDETALLKVGAGYHWHALVLETSRRGLHGLENLALIPGNAGAAPVQNIGAYGVEISNVLHGVEVLDMNTRELGFLSCDECQLAYRDSLFKQPEGARYLIVALYLRLSKKFSPLLTYPALSGALPNQNPSPQQLIDTVVEVRKSKLPDPDVIPNAGSFFKNPVVCDELANRIKESHPDMPSYPQLDGYQKLAAAWLIDRAGWRGKSHGKVAMHSKQALVLVNPDGGSGADVMTLAELVAGDVLDKFGVALEIEPRCVGG